MKYTTLLLTAAAGLALASPSAAQRRSSNDLAQARATFKAADKDANSKVSPGEAGRAKIPADLFVRLDADADRALSQDEFTLLYRELVKRAKQPVAADLEAEAVRIQAMRRARVVEAQKAKAAAEAAKAETVGTGSRLKEAQRELKDQKITASPASATTADKLKRARELLERRVNSGDMTRGTAQDISNGLNDRARNAEAQTQGDPATAATDSGTPATGDAPVTPQRTIAEQQLARSITVLNRMIREKRLTPDEAREVHALLQQRGRNAVSGTPALPTGAPLTQLFTRARGQLRRLQREGSITADEAREMHAALVERARAAGMANVPPETAEKPPQKPVSGDSPAPGAARAVAKTQLERSVAVLNRMIREKRLTPDEARDFYGLLRERAKNAIVNASTPAPSAAAIETMLRRAQAQVTTQQRNGFLSPDEAREMNASLIERARAASVKRPAKPAPAKGPADSRRGTGPEKKPAERAKPADGKPGPATGRGKPATPTGREKPKPTTDKPKPTGREKPKPTTEKPKPVVDKPKPTGDGKTRD